MNSLEIKNIVFGYHKEEVLKNISFSVRRGDFLGIVGPNGAGKTTVFKLISKLLKPWSGEILYNGTNLNNISLQKLARSVAVIPQILETPFSFTVEEFVSMGRFPHLGRFQSLKKQDYKIVEEALLLADVSHLKFHRLSELSGGERQRVILAQGFTQTPQLFLLDEPTAHLDITHQVGILDLIKRLNKQNGLTVIVVLHDLNLASEYCDKVILLKDGKIFKAGSPWQVFTFNNIEEVYKTTVVVKENPISSKPYCFLVSEEEKQRR
ncbi:MAG: ABC transporter ATP-binding protein [Candidatus Omnitrophota bacterium]|nr:MAG: ABC transporter ATP-binding protein [Candidatus Omnitrophota bacterium]